MSMKWYECKNESELKNIDSFKDVKRTITQDLQGKVDIKASGWADLYDKISVIQKLFVKSEDASIWFDGFVSETEKYLFCLTKLDGKNRQSNLGVNGLHYKNKKLADKWRNKIAHKIHTDICKDPRAKEAMQVLDGMHKEMIK